LGRLTPGTKRQDRNTRFLHQVRVRGADGYRRAPDVLDRAAI